MTKKNEGGGVTQNDVTIPSEDGFFASGGRSAFIPPPRLLANSKRRRSSSDNVENSDQILPDEVYSEHVLTHSHQWPNQDTTFTGDENVLSPVSLDSQNFANVPKSPWPKRFFLGGLVAGLGAATYWFVKTFYFKNLPSNQHIPKPPSSWTPTTWTKLVELLKLRQIKELVFRDDAVFFRDTNDDAYVTGMLPGSASWLFEQLKSVPFLLSVPFSKHLALLPFRWNLKNLSEKDQLINHSSIQDQNVTAPPVMAPPLDLPDFNQLEEQMTILSQRASRETKSTDAVDNLWSTIVFLSLAALCFVDWPWNSNSMFFRFFLSDSNKKLERTKTTFADVAGHQNTKEELKQIIEFLKRPEEFVNLGARMPRGILLEGRSGTGKTLLARAVAGEASVPFFYGAASSFVEIYVGQGASRVRQFFAQARKNAPCVIFIDEVDALGTSRSLLGNSNQEYVQTLNQLLTEMDGLERLFSEKGDLVIVMAATNRYESLDEALTRPGRFDRIISLSSPTIDERERICHIHTRGKRLDFQSVKLRTIAELTDGWTGAEIECLFNEAALLAARSGATEINSKHISQILADLHKRRQKAAEARRQLLFTDGQVNT